MFLSTAQLRSHPVYVFTNLWKHVGTRCLTVYVLRTIPKWCLTIYITCKCVLCVSKQAGWLADLFACTECTAVRCTLVVLVYTRRNSICDARVAQLIEREERGEDTLRPPPRPAWPPEGRGINFISMCDENFWVLQINLCVLSSTGCKKTGL